MARDRLTTALEAGQLTLPAGEVTVLRPPPAYDLSALPRDQLRLTCGFRPDLDAFAAAGYDAVSQVRPAPTMLVVVPRTKALAHALIAEAARHATLVIVDGQKSDGTDAIFTECRKRLGDLPSVTKAHGRLFWFAGPTDAFADWAVPGPVKGAHGYFTAPGVFSDDAPDPGSVLLAAALPSKLPHRMADLGAGWGYLAQAVLAREGVTHLDLIEAEALALDCARLNVTDPRAAFHWADATRLKPAAAYDGIVMNPPFHVGRAADPALGRAFIAAAARMLTAGGQMWMVANRHLPYEAALHEHFREVTEIGGDGGFKLFHAARPVSTSKPRTRSRATGARR
ncbi:MAG: methyltransferase [Limimaricola sp.]|uniref:class I SAM-dependent methyltransferase n=1 Tax=Limimaricola sp. TaxID=2211665 RepID=UPI001E112B6C|nr:methyltransferase [Limimaricola sp.]MBI1417475.1 methyltransferase [Limimaricola sp.]